MIGNQILGLGAATYISLTAVCPNPINLNPDCNRQKLACIVANMKLPSLTLNHSLSLASGTSSNGTVASMNFSMIPSLDVIDTINSIIG